MSTARASALSLVLLTSMVACSGGDDEAADARPGEGFDASAGAADARRVDAMPGAPDAALLFTLTSSAFSEGEAIPQLHTCHGDNVSPALAWSSPPAGAMSYAIVFDDITFNFLHSVTWDIPVSVTSIPEDVDKDFEPADLPGAKQARSYLNSRGYAGPCPPEEHTYEFRIHALNVATLPDVGANTNRADARAAVEAASIGFATLTGTFDPPQ